MANFNPAGGGERYHSLIAELKSLNLVVGTFNSKFLSPLLQTASKENKSIILLGDFNIDLLKFNNPIFWILLVLISYFRNRSPDKNNTEFTNFDRQYFF